MAYTKLMQTADGRRFYKIEVSQGRGKSKYTRRWYVPDGWGQTTIDRELRKAAAEFERACAAGEVETRAQAKEKAAAAAAEAAKLKTVRQYADNVFMPAKEVSFSESARANYRTFLDQHILPILGEQRLVDVTPAMISRLLTDFQRNGYAHATAIKLYNILNGLFEMAFLDDSIPINPLLKVKRPAPSKDEAPQDESAKAYTAQELAQILKCVQQAPLKWRAYINLAADTGARRGELCGLHWSDIDWKGQTITIRHNLQYTPKKGVYDAAPKNGRFRTVDVGSETLHLLRLLRDQQAASCISQWVFTQDGSPEPMHPQRPTRYFKKFGERYGIADFHPHKLRHTSASVALTNGADVVSVSQRLGHRDTSTTLNMYAHANEESIRRAGQIVRDAIRVNEK